MAKHTVVRDIKSKRPAGPHRALVATYRCTCGCYAGMSAVAYATEGDLEARDPVPQCPITRVHKWLETNPRASESSASICLEVEPRVVSLAFAELRDGV